MEAIKKQIKTQDIVAVYNIMRSLKKLDKLPKNTRFKVMRTLCSLKPVVTEFEDSISEARERLKPDGFDAILAKARDFDNLPDKEKIEVNMAMDAYQKEINECMRPVSEKCREIELIEEWDMESISELPDANENLGVDELMFIKETLTV